MCRDLISKIVTLLKSIATGIGNIGGDATTAKAYTDAVSNNTSLTAETDINTLTSTITYRVGNMSSMTNGPTGAGTTGILKIEAYGSYILQTFIGNTAIKYRFSFDNATTWGEWT